MRKPFYILLTLALLLACAAPAFAADGTADVSMEGADYHLRLEGVELQDGRVRVSVAGYDAALKMNENGVMIAAVPAARYGGTIIRPSQFEIKEGGLYSFLFERAELPEELWLIPWDKDEPQPLIWEAGEPGGSRETAVEDALHALGDEVYRSTYEALLAGETIGSGSSGRTAKGVQETLIAFGQSISADGSVGGKTIAALNAVQEAHGLEQTETVDAAVYAQLLLALYAE